MRARGCPLAVAIPTDAVAVDDEEGAMEEINGEGDDDKEDEEEDEEEDEAAEGDEEEEDKEAMADEDVIDGGDDADSLLKGTLVARPGFLLIAPAVVVDAGAVAETGDKIVGEFATKRGDGEELVAENVAADVMNGDSEGDWEIDAGAPYLSPAERLALLGCGCNANTDPDPLTFREGV